MSTPFDRFLAQRIAQLARGPVAPVGNPFQGRGPVVVPNLGPPPSERQQAVLNQNVQLGPAVPPPQPPPFRGTGKEASLGLARFPMDPATSLALVARAQEELAKQRGIEAGVLPTGGGSPFKTLDDVMSFVNAAPYIAETFMTGQPPRETGITLNEPVPFSVPALFGQVGEVTPDVVEKPVKWLAEQYNKPLESREERQGELMYITAKSGQPAPQSLVDSLLEGRYDRSDETPLQQIAYGDKPSTAEFINWALEHPEEVVKAYENGHTPVVGRYAGQKLTGDRAVWELYINQQSGPQRAAYTVGLDPLAKAEIVAGGFGGALSQTARELRAAELAATEGGDAARAGRFGSRATMAGTAGTALEAVADPASAAAKVLGRGVGFIAPEGSTLRNIVSRAPGAASSEASRVATEQAAQADALAQVSPFNEEFNPTLAPGGSTTIKEVPVTGARGGKGVGFVIIDEQGRELSAPFTGGKKKAREEAEAARQELEQTRPAGEPVDTTETLAGREAQPTTATSVAEAPAPVTVRPTEDFAVPDGNVDWQALEQRVLEVNKTKADRNAAIVRGEISEWTPIPGGNRVIDKTIRNNAFWNEVASEIRARVERNRNLSFNDFPRDQLRFDNKALEDSISKVETQVDVVAPAYQRHVGALPEDMQARTTAERNAIYKAGRNTEEDASRWIDAQVEKAVLSPSDAKFTEAMNALRKAYGKQPWFAEYERRITSARQRLKATYEQATPLPRSPEAQVVPEPVTPSMTTPGGRPVRQISERQYEIDTPNGRLTVSVGGGRRPYHLISETDPSRNVQQLAQTWDEAFITIDDALAKADEWATLPEGTLPRDPNKILSAQTSAPTLESPPPAQIAPEPQPLIPENTNPPAPGMVRLYRSEVSPEFRKPKPDWMKQGQDASGHTDAVDRWFTDTPENLQWYVDDIGADKSRITYIDIPESQAEQYRVSNTPTAARFSLDKETEYFVPRDVADQRRPITEAQIAPEPQPVAAAPETVAVESPPTPPQTPPETPRETPWTASFRKGDIDQAAHDFYDTDIVVKGETVKAGKAFYDILRKRGITQDSPIADWVAAQQELKRLIAGDTPKAKWPERFGLGVVRAIDDVNTLKRDALMFSPANIGGMLGDIATDIITPFLHGDWQTAAKNLDLRMTWHAYKHARAGTSEAKSIARQNIDGVRQIETGWGQPIPHELEYSTGAAGDLAAETGPHTALQRKIRAVTGGRGGTATDIISAPLGGSKEFKSLRLAHGEQARFGAYEVAFNNYIRGEGGAYFDESLYQLGRKLGRDPAEMMAEISAAAEARFNETPWGRYYQGEFTPEDIRTALGADGEDLARKWRNQLSKANTVANARQKLYYHDYLKTTKADVLAKRLFLFSFWYSRQFRLYAKLTAQNPFLAASTIRFWESVQRQAEQDKLPEFFQHYAKFMGSVGGMYSVFDPVGILTPWSMFDDVAKEKGYGNLFDQFVDRSPFMVAPWFKAAATMLNLHDPSGGYVDPFFSEKFRGVARALINYGAANGIDMLKPYQGAKDPISAAMQSMENKVRKWAGGDELPELTNSEHVAIGNIAYDLVKSGQYSQDELGPALDALVSGGDDGDLLAAAEKVYWTGQAKGRSVGVFVPGGTQTRYGPSDKVREEAKAAFKVPKDERTPEQQAAVDQYDITRSADPERDLMFQEYETMGTDRQKALAEGFNAIAFGNVPAGSVVVVGNNVYTKADLNQMTDDGRRALANQWLDSVSGTAEHEAYTTERKAFVEKNPILAEYKDFQKRMRDYDGGPIAAAEYLAGYSPAFADYWERSDKSEGAALSQSAWLAQKGAAETIYDQPKDALDISKVPASSLLPGAGGIGGSGQSTYDPVAALIDDIASYEEAAAMADAYVAKVSGGRITKYADLDPMSRQMVDQQLDVMGMKPYKSRTLEYYEFWKANLAEGKDNSPAAFIAWRDKYAADLTSASATAQEVLAGQ
ncbi:MAG TPA: hypothetical protein VLA89_06755 [Gemmatimonadales bacterium]|nr:hypothetical protein [Gemmatimonadales bacterium]